MKNIIKKVPIPLAGVMLGVTALGNLLQSYSEGVRLFCGAIAVCLCILIIAKLILFPKMIKEDMANPIMASVAANFPMALMLLSGYAKPFIGSAAVWIWYFAIALHVILIIYFTIKFMAKPVLPKVFASYFIVYVGIAAGAVVAPAHEKQNVGTALFWFAFVTFLLLLCMISYRYMKLKEIPEPARPLICIFAAPASLCLAGYIQSVEQKSLGMILFLAIIGFILYLFALVQLPKLLRLKFYPSYASFTFPFVISAIGLKMTMAVLGAMEKPQPWLQYVVLVETVIAVILVGYTLIRFVQFLFVKAK